MNEIWKPIPTYPMYEASNLGRIRNCKRNKILKKSNCGGYEIVMLYNNGKGKIFGVHRLIWWSFNKFLSTRALVIDHINHDKKDNRLSNLQILTQRQNTSKQIRETSSIYPGVTYRKDSDKWRARVQFNGRVFNIGSFKTESLAYEAYREKLKQFLNE
jgi:hypothetical protein